MGACAAKDDTAELAAELAAAEEARRLAAEEEAQRVINNKLDALIARDVTRALSALEIPQLKTAVDEYAWLCDAPEWASELAAAENRLKRLQAGDTVEVTLRMLCAPDEETVTASLNRGLTVGEANRLILMQHGETVLTAAQLKCAAGENMVLKMGEVEFLYDQSLKATGVEAGATLTVVIDQNAVETKVCILHCGAYR